MKKLIAVIICLSVLICPLIPNLTSFTLISNAEDGAIDMNLNEQLFSDNESADLSVNSLDFVKQRVIVKSDITPIPFENVDYIKNNGDFYIYQYQDTETAIAACDYYESLTFVEWAEFDGIAKSQAASYGNPMMQGDEAKEYIIDNSIPQNEVIVAVVDTGAFFDDKTFSGRIIDSGINFTETGTENSALDDNGHGSNVTHILADNTSDCVKIVAYKALDRYGYGYISDIANAVYEAVDDGVDVINMSISSPEDSSYLRSAIDNAVNNGIPVIVAAGNGNEDASNCFPASYDNVFTVGSIDKNGNKSIISNYGEDIDFVAPGHFIEVYSAEYAYGTSFAAPFVAAATAMLFSIDPDLTVDEAKAFLKESCVPYENLAYHDGFHSIMDYDLNEDNRFWLVDSIFNSCGGEEKEYYGSGMPQISKAVALALGEAVSVQAPTLSAESGVYHEVFSVTISSPDGYEIYYTTDESYPSELNGNLYTGSITISDSQSVRAVAYSKDGMRSNAVGYEYEMQYYADEADFTIDENGYITGYAGVLTEFVIPSVVNGATVTGIGESAFYSNTDIKSIVFPETLTEIAESAFDRSSIERVKGLSVKTVGKSGFRYCENLFSAEMPELENIGSFAFGSCNLRKVDYPKLNTAGSSAFISNKSLSSVSLPQLEKVEMNMFNHCNMLVTARFDNAKSIGHQAFNTCYWLKSLYAPLVETLETVSNPAYSTFYNCRNLADVNLLSVKNIPKKCFQLCITLPKVDFPCAVDIATSAFGDCWLLKEVNLPKAQTIGDAAFAYTQSLTQLNLPAAITIGENVFLRSGLISLQAENLISLGSYAFAFQSEMQGDYIQNPNFESLYAPKLENAADYAFSYTGALEKLELPNLKTLGEGAFEESGVVYLDAPNLTTSASLPTKQGASAILSSKFTTCTLDATGYDLTIYGTPTTYAENYANLYDLKFVAAPAIIKDLPEKTTGDVLETDVAGFNKQYQWYANDINSNEGGTPIEGATEKTFDPATYPDAKYYYCEVISTDGDFEPITIKTSACENRMNVTVEEEKSCITNVTYEPSRETRNTFTVTVDNRPTMIQFIEPDGGTRTYDRNNKNVTIKSYDADGNEVNSLDRNLAYEVWEIYSNMSTDVEIKARAKYLNEAIYSWDKVTYNFTVELLPLDGAVRSVTPAATSGCLGAVSTTVVTGSDAEAIRFKMENGTTTTYYANKATVLENGDLQFVGKAWANNLGENIITVQVRVKGKWQTAATFTYTADDYPISA